MLKIGIIGTSQISQQFVKTCQLNKNIEVVAVYSRTKAQGEKFAKTNQISDIYCEMDKFLASEIEAVYIASPNSIHYEQAKAALHANKHVLVEKPVSSYLERTEELFQIAKERELILHEAILTVPSDAYQYAKSKKPDLGEIHGFDMYLMKQTRHYPDYLQGKYLNVFDGQMEGGAINDLGIYCLYPIVDFFGLASSLSLNYQASKDNADLSSLVTFEYPSFTGTMRVSKLVSNENQSVIYGTKASMYISNINHFELITIKHNDGRVEKFKRGNEVLMEPELNYFINKVNGKQTKEFVGEELTLKVANVLDELRCLRT